MNVGECCSRIENWNQRTEQNVPSFSMTTKSKTKTYFSFMRFKILKSFSKTTTNIGKYPFCWRNFIDRKSINSKIQQFTRHFHIVMLLGVVKCCQPQNYKKPVFFPVLLKTQQVAFQFRFASRSVAVSNDEGGFSFPKDLSPQAKNILKKLFCWKQNDQNYNHRKDFMF